MSRLDDSESDHYRQQSAQIIKDALNPRLGLDSPLSTADSLFATEMHLHSALRALHEAERVLAAMYENAPAPDLPTVGFGAAVSLISKLHGAVRRAQ